MIKNKNRQRPPERERPDRDVRACADLRAFGDDPYPGSLLAIRLSAAAAALVLETLLEIPEPWRFIMLFAAAILAGYNIIYRAVSAVARGGFADQSILAAAASIALFAVGSAQEGAAVMMLAQTGALLAAFMAHRKMRAIEDSVDTRPETACVMRQGKAIAVPADSIAAGEIIIIRPGERTPADCVVLRGKSAIDLSSLTGEEQPLLAEEEVEIPSGAVNRSAELWAEVLAVPAQSTAARKLHFIGFDEGSAQDTEIASPGITNTFLISATAFAVLLAALLPLLTDISLAESVGRAAGMIIMAGSCAFTLSSAIACRAVIASAASRGILFRNCQIAKKLAGSRAVVFDKAGTLTDGRLAVISVKPNRLNADTMLNIAAHAVAYSDSPTASAIKAAYKGPIFLELIEAYDDSSGNGVKVRIDGKEIILGSREFLNSTGVSVQGDDFGVDNAVFIAVGGIYAGRITLTDPIREDAATTVRELIFSEDIRVAMLSEDNSTITASLAKELGIKEYYADCGRSGKAAAVRKIREDTGGSDVVLAGSGATEPEAFAASDVGVYLGDLKPGLPAKAVSVAIMDGKPGKIAEAIQAAKRLKRAQRLGIALALAGKSLVFLACALGIVSPWAATVADAGICLLCVAAPGRIDDLDLSERFSFRGGRHRGRGG